MPFPDDLLEQAYDLAHKEPTDPKQASLRRTVAHNFIQLQQHRHTADYDNSKQWSRTDVLNVLTLATDAFTAWRAISTQDAAQDYLLQLFLPKLPKQ
jgi:hypothetical protein